MNKTGKYSDREWEDLASGLSGEKEKQPGLLKQFMAEDIYNTGEQWKELRDMNSGEEVNTDKAWNNVYSRMKENGLPAPNNTIKRNFTRNTFLRIAAIGIILLSIGTTVIYLNNAGVFSKEITLVSGNDQKNVMIDLPDGSRVILNRNSKFSYRSNFGSHKRDVKLEGEAFFEISADDIKPFIIDAGNAKVKVVGTAFNVITSNEESAVEVFVKSGKVMVTDNTQSQPLLLDPGFVGKVNSKISEKIINTNPNYMSWNTGLLVYNGQKLDIIFNDLKRVYNMDIVADDSDILNNTWTSPIDNQPQETIIRLICASFNLSYTKDGPVYHLSKK